MSKNKQKTNFIVKIFKALYSVLDKLIVTPISRIVYRIDKLVKRHTGFLDGVLNKPKTLITFSLAVAVIAFIFVNTKSINLIETESEILSSQPVSTTYNQEKYVIDGIPESVDIILMGKKSDLYLAKQLGDHKVVLDLSDYKPGEYKVKLKYNHSVASISYRLIPESVTVKISEKESAVRTLAYDLLNQDKLDSKLSVKEVVLNENEVYVKGSKETIEKVATVKALIDVSSAKLKEKLSESGTFEIDGLPMVAYDENGNVIENVEIVPNTASGKITIDSYYVDLPVKVVPNGHLATGYAISSATSSLSTVRVYGDQAVITNIPYVKAEIDVDKLNANKEYKVMLTKPSGVRYMSEEATTVKVTVAEESTKEIELQSIDYINLSSGHTAQLKNIENQKCTVIVKGVKSVIDKLNEETIKAYVDLSGYGVGEHEVDVIVEGQDLTLSYEAKVKKVAIIIE